MWTLFTAENLYGLAWAVSHRNSNSNTSSSSSSSKKYKIKKLPRSMSKTWKDGLCVAHKNKYAFFLKNKTVPNYSIHGTHKQFNRCIACGKIWNSAFYMDESVSFTQRITQQKRASILHFFFFFILFLSLSLSHYFVHIRFYLDIL